MDKYAVITGASKGLGKSIALELAKAKHNIILVSLPGEGLSELCNQLILSEGIKALYYETDFSVYENIMNLSRWLNDNFRINMLINNAGVGGTKKFLKAGSEYIYKIIQINVVAPSVLIHNLLPNLLRQKESYILNISSIASFCPSAFKTVYPASKKFISYLSKGINEEFKDTSLSVSVAYPGPMATNGDLTHRLKKHGLIGRFLNVDTSYAAKKSVEGLLHKRKRIIISLSGYVSFILLRFLPGFITIPLLSRSFSIETSE